MTTDIPDGPVLIYFFHPFYRKRMKAVFRNIENWLKSRKSKAFVVYYNPMYFDLYDKSSLFRRVYVEMMNYEPDEMGTGPGEFDDALVIWQSVGEPMLQSYPHVMARLQIEHVRNRVVVLR